MRDSEGTFEQVNVLKALQAPGVSISPASNFAVGIPAIPFFYECGFPTAVMAGTLGAGIDLLHALPIAFVRPARIDQITFRVTVVAAGAGRARVGVYSSDPNTFRPTTLLAEGTDFDTSAGGGVGDKTNSSLPIPTPWPILRCLLGWYVNLYSQFLPTQWGIP